MKTQHLNLTPLNLCNGLYAVILSNGQETKSIKLLIQKYNEKANCNCRRDATCPIYFMLKNKRRSYIHP